MKLTSIYLDGGSPENETEDGLNFQVRKTFLRRVLENPVGDSQFLVSNSSKGNLESQGILGKSSQMNVINPFRPTSGALASALLPYDQIENSSPIMLLPTNSVVETLSLKSFINEMWNSDYKAGVLLVKSDNPNFSFVRMFDSKIIEFVEKTVVGNLATTGVFFFQSKSILLECARWAFVNNQIIANKYYVAPSLNHILTSGGSIGYQIIDSDLYEHSTWTHTKG